MTTRSAAKLLICMLLWMCLAWSGARAQTRTVATVTGEFTDFYRPQVAASPDGSTAIAWEALHQGQFATEWIIAVQRFAPDAEAVGSTRYYEPEIGCFGGLDIWLNDYQSNVELAFTSVGRLIVLMQHSGEYDAITHLDISSEITLGILDVDGSILDLDLDTQDCVQWKFVYPGADEQDRPRMALTNEDVLLLTMDGFFDGSDLRNVGLAGYNANLQDLFGGIPHDDPSSAQAFHMWPDVATNGTVIAGVWHECPIVDPQGNADECDIGAQFFQVQQDGSLAALGQNQTVNAGDPAGTLNWRPSVAMTPAGSSVVAWQDYRNGPMGDVYAQLFNASGQPVGQNIRVSEGTGFMEARAEIRPEVAMLNDGRFMVVWADSSSAGFLARGRTFSASGQPDGPAVVLSQGSGVQSGMPAVASNGANFYYTFLALSGGQVTVQANIGTSGTARDEDIARTYDLSLDVYPNPFRRTATVHVGSVGSESVDLVLYDALGRAVQVLHRGPVGAGAITVRVDGSRLPPGPYFLRMTSGATSRTRALVKVD